MSERYVMPLLQRRMWMASTSWISVSCVWTRDPWCLPHLQLSGRSSKELVKHQNLSRSITYANFKTVVMSGISWCVCCILFFTLLQTNNPVEDNEDLLDWIEWSWISIFLKVILSATCYSCVNRHFMVLLFLLVSILILLNRSTFILNYFPPKVLGVLSALLG